MNFVSLARSLGIEGIESGKEYSAKCPLHHDNNPSFSMNIDTGQYICFSGCGSGSFNQLVEKVLGCSPQEARDFIINHGQTTSVEQTSKSLGQVLFASEISEVKTSDNGWLEYYNSLHPGKIRQMPVWFLERGFTWETVHHWDIRYDGLSDSVVIPVKWKGELVGTVTRRKEGLPKYVNSPKLPGSKILFGEISSDDNTIILVEGILDALWLWQFGFNAASLLGSHLSTEQINILREYRYGHIILALDNDEAGKQGTKEAIGKLTRMGWLLAQISIVKFPDGIKDVQEVASHRLKDLIENRKGCLSWS